MTKEKTNPSEDLLIKYLTGLADAGDRESALTWIRQSPENRRYFDELKTTYELSKLPETADNYHTEAALLRVKLKHFRNVAETNQQSEIQNRRVFRLAIMKYAALIVFLLSLGFVGYRFLPDKPEAAANAVWNTIDAPFGSRARLTLNDGTKVWLNAGSQLRYAADFKKSNRKVYLNGEAYFDVAKDEKSQFIVSTPHLDVKVFGTQFNIKAYEDENTVQTTLVEGSVSIEGKGKLDKDFKKVILKPNESATYYIDLDKAITESRQYLNRDVEPAHKEKMEVLKDINPVVYTSWKDASWMIDGEALSSLAIKLERRYNVKMRITSKELNDYKFRGTIKDETLEQVLNIIKLSAPIDFKIENNNVELFENKSFKNSYDEMLMRNTEN